MAAREMRLILQRDHDFAAAARVGDAMLTNAERLAAISSGDVEAISALLRFYHYFGSALTMDKSVGPNRSAPIALQFWNMAGKLSAFDPSDMRAKTQMAMSADQLGYVYERSEPARSADWFEKSVDLYLEIRRPTSPSANRDVSLWEAGQQAIRGRLRAGDRAKALEIARRLARVIDLKDGTGLKAGRSQPEMESQAVSWVAQETNQLKLAH
jgi:hypothetical protein